MADSKNRKNSSKLNIEKAQMLNLFGHLTNIRPMELANSPQPSNHEPPTTLPNKISTLAPTQHLPLSKKLTEPIPPENIQNLADALINVLGEEFEAVLLQKLLTRRMNEGGRFSKPVSVKKRESHKAKSDGHPGADIAKITNDKK